MCEEENKFCSVCMAVYNGSEFLEEQISSILEQMKGNDELIIIDDFSQDQSYEICMNFKDERINIHRNKKNMGVIQSFETAINLAKGEYIFLSDQDDIWMPEKMQKLKTELANGSLLTLSDCSIIDSLGNVLENSFFRWRGSKPGFFQNLIRNSFIGCSMAFRTEIKEIALPFPKCIAMHDEWIGLIASLNGPVTLVNSQLLYYRRHQSNASSMHRGTISSMLQKRICLFFQCLTRTAKARVARISFTSSTE